MVWVKITNSSKQSFTTGFTRESNPGLLCESPVVDPSTPATSFHDCLALYTTISYRRLNVDIN